MSGHSLGIFTHFGGDAIAAVANRAGAAEGGANLLLQMRLSAQLLVRACRPCMRQMVGSSGHIRKQVLGHSICAFYTRAVHVPYSRNVGFLQDSIYRAGLCAAMRK